MKKTIIIFLVALSIIYFFTKNSEQKIDGKFPAPTELIQKKKDRKLFKKGRKEYYRQMHKTAPDVDWQKMDDDFRRDKARIKTDHRRNFSTQIDDIHLRNFQSRDIEGFWQEKGSNNLSGRIHTSEVDFANDFIYCGSSGGNIWRGTLDGDNWESLNDYMQLPNITMLRLIDENDNRRLLIGTGNSRFYYTDNDGLVIEESEGLENIQSWGNIKRTIVQNNDQHTIYLLAKEWNYSTWQEVSSIYVSTDFGESFTKEWTTARTVSHIDIWSPRYLDNGSIFIQMDNEIFLNVSPAPTIESGDVVGIKSETYFLYKIKFQGADSLLLVEVSQYIREQFINSVELEAFVKKYKDLSFFFGEETLYIKDKE